MGFDSLEKLGDYQTCYFIGDSKLECSMSEGWKSSRQANQPWYDDVGQPVAPCEHRSVLS